MRALVVDDAIMSRQVLRKILEKHCDCDEAVDGEEAVEFVRIALGERQPYDLIMLDISLPSVDGQEALRRIREVEDECGIMLGDGTTVVMTTGHGDARNVLNAFENQCEGYLVKPVNEEKVIKELTRLGLLLENASR